MKAPAQYAQAREKDTRFHSTPLAWARHFEQPATIHILDPVMIPSVNPD
jgi:hypothetical protein